MCSNCKITLTLSEANNESNILKEETYSSQETWKEIKLFVDNVQTNSTLFISTIANNQRDVFWNIEPHIRECNNTEHRMIKSRRKLKCQLISNKDDDVISLDDDAKPTVLENNCADDAVTRHCIPCPLFLNQTCGQLKVCEKDGTELKCSCSAGWKYPTCGSKCDSGSYGMNCKKRCGHCSRHSCDFDNGKCEPCSDNYVGAKCDMPPGQVFSEPPVVSDIKYSEAKVKVENFELLNKKHTDSPDSYYVEYRKAEGNSEWMASDQRNPFNKSAIIKLQYLEPNTKYIVRGIIITINDKIFIDEQLPHAAFTTKCYEIKDEDFISNSYNTSIRVTFKSKTLTQFCNFTISLIRTSHAKESSHPKPIRYNIQQQNTIIPLRLENDSFCFKDLIPDTNYKIIVQKNKTKLDRAIRTTEGVPGAIGSLTITDIRDSSVRVKWKSPENFNGQFEKYVVTYQLVSHKSCKTSNGKTFPIKQLSTKETNVTVSDLVPYAAYSFSVSAWNGKVGGPPVTVIQNTFASETISDGEIPELKWKVEARSVKLHYSSMDCSIMRGPLQIRIKKSCSNEWCDNSVEQETECDFENTSCLVHVLPYSDYIFKIKFCRNGTCAKTLRSKPFQTLSEPPYRVRELTIFSKNESSISIRWMPPYPPTGKLDLYKVTYEEVDNNNNKGEMETFKDLPCTLWPEYQCFTLSQLEKIKKYSIKVQAKNEHPNSFGQTAVVVGTPKIEPSKKPNNLTIHWNLQNDLELTWGHPNETSGLITFFNISVLYHNSTKNNLHDSFPVTNYKPFYEYKIEEKRLLKSTPFRIRIEAFNGYNGEELVKNDTSPPALPLFSTEPKISTSNDTITIEISPIKSTNRDDTNKYELFLFLLDENFNNHDNVKSLTRLQENHHVNLSKFKILYQCQLKSPVHFKIGQDNYTINDCNRSSSSSLKQATTYNVTILLTNTIENKSSYKLYSYQVHTLGEPVDVPQDLSLLALLSLLLIIPIAIILFIKRGPLIENYNSLKTSMCQRTCLETSTPDEQTPLKNIAPQNTKLYSKKVKVAELEQYVTESLNNGELERQHALFPRGQTKPWERGALKENKSKNRYTNLMAYDHTRVVLQWINGNKNSDYINANYIDGYNVRKAYIATQGPKISTVHDFWRMIWQENVLHVAMLANIYEGKKKKVEKYWPDQNESLSFGDITVYHMSGQVFADYEQRTFKVCFNNQTRKLQQYHFSSWPDHGVPLYSQSLVPFLQKIQQIPLDSKSPVVVHCSAGVGRTGTILLCDICLRMAAKEDAVDMLRTLQQLRDQRANMVDNIQQYKLAHLVILECLVGKQTGIPCSEIETEVKKLLSGDRISQQMRYLKDTAWQDKTMKSVASNDAFVVVQEKNRFQNIVPEIQGCMFLSRYPIHDDTSTYINAVRVDGFRCPGRFIVTQQPMPNTLGDFWRLVHEKETTVIVSLNPVNPKNKTSCLFWPTEKQPELTPVDYITLKHATTLSLDSYNLTTIRMHINASEEYTVVQIISMKDWPAKKNCPKKIEDFLTFCEESYVISRQSSSVVVTCFDGVLASGVYVAMSFVIEKMKLEQICDVCQAVRTVRHNRNEFVQNEEQFAFLYKAAEAYITGFQFYANFS
ncbi:receptor-type tyrosine-protein phosphatase mu-like isoform X7 [Tenebrio molitor]